MLVSLALIVSAARMNVTRTVRLCFALVGLAVWIGILTFKLERVPILSILADAALITCATQFGVLVSNVIREPKLLLPVALCAGLVDIWGVSLGPVHLIEKHAPKIISKTTAKVPALGSARIAKGKRPPPPMLIGFGDFLFLGIFFACIVRFGMHLHASFALTALSTVVALIIVGLSDTMLPGLPFMALGVILPNIAHFRFTREEKFALLYTGILLTVVLTTAFVVSARVGSPGR
jgi:hypothetical protein